MVQLLSMSVFLASVFGWMSSLQLSLCNRMAKQVFTDQTHSVQQGSLHCYIRKLFVQWVQQRNFILVGGTDKSVSRVSYPLSWIPFFKNARQMMRTAHSRMWTFSS